MCIHTSGSQLNAQVFTAPLGSYSTFEHDSPQRVVRSDHDTLNLPFIDDFSYNGPKPNPAKWIDGGTFVNADFPINPPSWGVATFDGISASGQPYSNVLSHGAADTLTSLPIHLAYSPADSIYLSFALQPKGRGNFPEYVDTFLLEFKVPSDTAWRWIWSSKGEDFPQTDRPFRKVMIPINDTAFLKHGFQFRFRNFAQLNGAWDHWHLDYVRLDKGRFANDTLLMDFAFMYRGKSLLNTYQSIPLSHFLTSPVSRMSETFDMALVNNTIAPATKYYGYEFYNQFGQQVDMISHKIKGPIPAQQEFIMNEPTKYTYGDPGQSYQYATYQLVHMLNENNGDVIPQNDTTSYFQVLSNYYALDDGTAEERIGLENEQGGFIAQRFETFLGDTLKAIQYFFNAVNDGQIDRPFYLAVWSAGNNSPGALLYSQGPVQPSVNGWNKFTSYPLDQPLFLPAGSYYFGWMQENGTSLNLGLDRNITSNERIYYNHTGSWFNFNAQSGTLMLRPMFQKAEDTYVNISSPEPQSGTYRIFPNPSTSSFRISTETHEKLHVGIYDQTGRRLLSIPNYLPEEKISTDALSTGVYLVTVGNGIHQQVLRLTVVKP